MVCQVLKRRKGLSCEGSRCGGVTDQGEQLVSAFLTRADHISPLLSVLSKYQALCIVTSYVYLFSNY